MANILPAILCGGEGRRLAPLSTPEKPKPFLPLVGGRTLLSHTLERLKYIENVSVPYLIGQRNFLPYMNSIIADSSVKVGKMVTEPNARGTAAAVALVAMEQVYRSHKQPQGEEPLLLVLPSDHIIGDVQAWASIIKQASYVAKQDKIMLFGSAILADDSGYGYIQLGEKYQQDIYEVAHFFEKPSPEKMLTLVSETQCLWNAGMLLAKPSVLLEQLKRIVPAFVAFLDDAYRQGRVTDAILQPEAEAWAKLPTISIDTLLLEHASDLVVHPMDVGWSDVGTWERLFAGNILLDEPLCVGNIVAYPHLNAAEYRVGETKQLKLYRKDAKLYLAQAV